MGAILKALEGCRILKADSRTDLLFVLEMSEDSEGKYIAVYTTAPRLGFLFEIELGDLKEILSRAEV